MRFDCAFVCWPALCPCLFALIN